jgi:hypothetical protein
MADGGNCLLNLLQVQHIAAYCCRLLVAPVSQHLRSGQPSLSQLNNALELDLSSWDSIFVAPETTTRALNFL